MDAEDELDDQLHFVFKALADPTRRRILDHLRAGPRTTGWLSSCFENLSRYAVMKHLRVLEEAGLVVVRRVGRRRFNHLNYLPIRRIYERWMGPYAELWSSALLRLEDHIEDNEGNRGKD
jgi:DNA-binding transcriptional ArsR family regulator